MKLEKLIPEKYLRSFEGSGMLDSFREKEIGSVTADSRAVDSDSVFFCIKGAVTDGHIYASSAYERGCRIFVCERDIGLPHDALTIRVDNTRQAIALFAEHFYGDPASRLVLIGVTGTKGKSTVAEFIYRILEDCGERAAIIGTCGVRYPGNEETTNNTTPDAPELARLFAAFCSVGVRYVVMEVSSQACLLDRVYGLHFSRAVFTNIYPDHIGPTEHPNFESYLSCKARLFSMTDCAIVNADSPYSERITDGVTAPVLCFGTGEHGDTDYSASGIRRWNDRGIHGMEFYCVGTRFRVRMPGEISVYNALAAIAVCDSLGIPAAKISESLEAVTVKGRFETIESDGRTFVIDYAHNGASLESALRVLRGYTEGRLIVLFGSVGGRTRLRRREMGEAADGLADFCIVTSDNPDAEDQDRIIMEICSYIKRCPYIAISDRAFAIKYAVEHSKPGDTVLLAGKGHEQYQLIDGKKIPFSEKEILEKEIISRSGSALTV